jgi:hypothetical protein
VSAWKAARLIQISETQLLPHVSSSRRRRLGLDISWDVSGVRTTEGEFSRPELLTVDGLSSASRVGASQRQRLPA